MNKKKFKKSNIPQVVEDKETKKMSRPKEVQQILEEQIDTSLKEFNRSYVSLIVSAFTAGLEIGFSVLLMGAIASFYSDQISTDYFKFYIALCYPLGFIFVIIGRSELFTEHTALAILPLLKGFVKLKDLLVLWGLVYAGNIIGGFFFSLLLVNLGPEVGFINTQIFGQLAYDLVNVEWNIILVSAMLAGWMMGLLGWLVTSSQDTTSRIILIILITSIIGVAGLHHCVIGSIEMLAGWLEGDRVDGMDYLKFQFWTTLGNAIGGSVFVAILKYSHAKLN
ncbi:MAG TPA: formate/nitrite transporter family protein [Cyclobacteriaceae bacterium]